MWYLVAGKTNNGTLACSKTVQEADLQFSMFEHGGGVAMLTRAVVTDHRPHELRATGGVFSKQPML